jgi:hypothetical protein
MRSSTLFLVAPFPLFSAAWAIPKSVVELGPGEEVEVQCQEVTVTETKWLPGPTSASGTQGVGRPVAVAMTAGEPLPSVSTSPGASQAVVVAADETAPFSNTTVKHTSGYRNALYFTNWFVTCIKRERAALTISGAFMAPTRSLKNYPPTKSPMCSTPLPTLRLMERCKSRNGTPASLA